MKSRTNFAKMFYFDKWVYKKPSTRQNGECNLTMEVVNAYACLIAKWLMLIFVSDGTIKGCSRRE
jgi:hypothetical protein